MSALRTAIEDLIQCTCEALPETPARTWVGLGVDEQGRRSWGPADRPNYPEAIGRALQKPEAQSAFRAAFAAVREDSRLAERFLADAVGKPVPPNHQEGWVWGQLVLPLVNEYFMKAGKAALLPNVLDEIFHPFEADLDQRHRSVTIVAPLDTVSISSPSLQVDERLSIRPVTDREREYWINIEPFAGLFQGTMGVHRALDITSCAELIFRAPLFSNTAPPEANDANEAIQRFISVLCLLTDRNIRIVVVSRVAS